MVSLGGTLSSVQRFRSLNYEPPCKHLTGIFGQKIYFLSQNRAIGQNLGIFAGFSLLNDPENRPRLPEIDPDIDPDIERETGVFMHVSQNRG